MAHAAELLALNKPVVLAGDYNVMPTDLDVYAAERWRDMPCSVRKFGRPSSA